MNNDIAEGKWKQMKGKLQAKWGELTDGDLERIQGRRDVFAGVMQEKYGKGKEEAERAFDQLRDDEI